ncbi:MAG: DUF1513 domain-containing protein [Pseudomonadota bacterium]
MANRRQFLGSLFAAGLAPSLTWADAKSPRFLAAAKLPNGNYRLFGLDVVGRDLFSLPLPGRGHAACAHPVRPEAVAFARRPGTFAIVLDCARGEAKAVLEAPPDRHFYGHGAFSQDGHLLYTTENAYEIGEGRIGIWDAADHYRRVGEFSSGGIGPHEIRRLPGTDVLVVANGGIDTHPETGRQKLNLSTMRSNLTYLDKQGAILEQVTLPKADQLNSIRHLAVSDDGLVAFACQWQGALSGSPALQGVHRLGSKLRLLQVPPNTGPLQGYAGSVAVARESGAIGVTYPRANKYAIWRQAEPLSGELHEMEDACGIAPSEGGFTITSGTGAIVRVEIRKQTFAPKLNVSWDNHLVAI